MSSTQAGGGIALLKSKNNKTGYFGVTLNQSSQNKPYVAQVKRGGKRVHLGSFAAAEEAALCVARSLEGQAQAKKAAVAPPLTSEEARQQAQAEGLTLRVARNSAGYFGVHLNNPGYPKPYKAEVRCDGKVVHLGYFATAEEAALCVARSPEGQAAAAERAAAAAPLTSEEARQQAQAEKLTLVVAETRSGYFGVSCLVKPGQSKPYKTQVRRGGKQVNLGYFATAEEAALCVARSAEGQAVAAERAAAAPPLTSEEARQQAQAEGLTLLVASTGYFGVAHKPGNPKPYQARVWRGGKTVQLGSFATAEEAALCVARSPEGQALAAERAAAVTPLTSEEARQQARAEGLTLRVAKSNTGYFGVNLSNPAQPKPYQARVHRGGKHVYLGNFATAEEAALCVARLPEGQVAADQAASTASLKDNAKGNPPAMPSVAILDDLNEEGTVLPMPPGAILNEEGMVPPMPPGANRRDGLFLLEERARRACFLLESAGRHEEERPKSQRVE